MARRPLRILIVDDHDVVRFGLEATLGARYDVVGSAATGAEALEATSRTKPDVVVVDFRLRDMLGHELCRRLRRLLPGVEVVILSTYVSEETVRLALDAGATAYVTKAAGVPELSKVLEGIQSGEPPPRESAPQVVSRLHALAGGGSDSVTLTPQQASVLELAAQGLTNLEIGTRLYIAESTVRFHLQKLKAKLGARSKTDLIARAIRIGAIHPAVEDTTPRARIRR